MPKAGVGIRKEYACDACYLMFQSIYAQSGRWNFSDRIADEEIEARFNPFMPKAGVGILLILGSS